MESLKSEMNLKTFHHEGHEDHEYFCELGIKPPIPARTDCELLPYGNIPANPDSYGCMILGDHTQREFNFFHTQMFFFVAFVFFVVQMGFAK